MQHPFPPWTLLLSGRPGPSCQSQDSLLPGAPAALHHPVCRPGEVCVCDLAACRTRMATCIGLPSLQQAQTQKRVSQDGEGGIFQHALVTPQEFPGAVRPAPVQGLQLPSHKLVPPAVASRYYAECHGVIYVIDSTDEERLSESKRAFEKMVTSEVLDGVPILVLANKQDVETCLSIPDIKTAFSDCTSKIGRRDCLTQACSALTGKGVREGIEWMVKCVVRNVHRPPRQRDIT
ncbi:ADP-ribosylation factor-related protein 1 isoform X1 [Ursus maritimus]|uniref:ADP ribosylation factor related protein 1 n=1 Tax=Ursus maritimus TaxID=29073 RepID=A0A452VA83_URSMA|nr:ADP-ribosylation factor-related protein 1 isoform X1 [Ursus maritimus]XP_048078195.1 ADP-ribosylation factor-related protein 1 isoform X2 [Ursus arctos]